MDADVNDAVWMAHVQKLEAELDLDLIHYALPSIVREAWDYSKVGTGQGRKVSFWPPLHSHPGMEIACNDDLHDLAMAAVSTAPASIRSNIAKENYEKLVSLW